MDSPDLAKLRRFALTVALVLITLVMAQVRLKTPVEIAPIGVPMIINKPYLLTDGLVLASIYATLRFIYYGMLAQPSPMRARRELPNMKRPNYAGGTKDMENFHAEAQKQVDRYFPSFGKQRVTFQIQGRDSAWHVIDMNIPRAVRAMSLIDTMDFLLPIVANVAAVGLWVGTTFGWN